MSSKARDDYWIIPAAALTGGLALLGLLLLPDKPTPIEAFEQFAAPAFVATVMAVLYKTGAILRAGENAPILSLLQWVKTRQFRAAAIGVALASANLTAFLWVKRGLNAAIPFEKDELLANLDSAVFFGRDPWTLMKWLDNSISAAIYHPLWLLVLLTTLLLLFSSPPSKQRRALIITYFLMWSVVGPLIHTISPAAGPLFYDDLGLGNRFENLGETGGTRLTANYLWSSFQSGASRYGSGISAMPSMHVTMACWVALAFYELQRQYYVAALVFALVIWILSVALGWHYALDGVVGGASTLLVWSILRPKRPTQRIISATPRQNTQNNAVES